MTFIMSGNVPRGPLVLDLASIPRDLACSSVDLSLIESRFHPLISESDRSSRLIFG
ncbi:hypothetical protein COLO4_35416 [Corchorus olitorius]|uniref:Uncharacterized protein n=1 Tax=Corchorus olitorius TaxID=93759 RepID=A0A1R3GH24_9ROSI|nr:hypothetical protein COLO4_35416 [Corchorus olitorius]